MSFDFILREIAGEWSFYQILGCICLGIIGKFYSAMLVFLNVFTAYKMDYQCVVDNETSIAVDKCEMRLIQSNKTVPCTEWIFDQSVFQSSIRSEYSLVCEREWLVPFSTMSHMLGMYLSSFPCGVISDMYGRRTLILVSAVVGGGAVIGLSYVPYYWMYVVLRLLTGFANVGCFLGVNSYQAELSMAHLRLEYITICMTGFNFGSLILVALSYCQRDYKMIQLLVAPFAFINVLFFLFFCESPRWLLAKKGRKSAYSACQWIARVNGKSLPYDEFENLCDIIDKKKTIKEKTIWDVMLLPNLRRVSFALWTCFVAVGFVFYSLNFGTSLIGGSIFVNFTVVTTIQFPGRLMAYIGTKYQGRQRTLTCTYSGTSLFIFACVPLILYSDMEPYLLTLYVLASLNIGIAFDVMWVYSLDIYPTVVRSSGVSVGQSFARIGSILAPQVENLSNLWPPLSFILSGTMSLVAALSSWCALPETGKMITKDFIPEAEEFIEKNQKRLCSRNCLCCLNPAPDEIPSDNEEKRPFADKE